MKPIRAVLSFALSTCWAMEEQFHRRMMAVLFRHADGVKLTDEEIEAATGSNEPKVAAEYTVANGVATIPIHGVIAHRAAAVNRVSSRVGASVEGIRESLQAALADPKVRAIMLDVDSPGGSVTGIAELADEIRAAREQKPIVAHTDAMMASAAYWLASQADRVSSTKSAMVGSIGVITSFYDTHRAAQNDGYDPVVIKSVPGKSAAQSNGSLGDAGRADLQAEVDHYHEMFVEGVAAGRGIGIDEARAMGDGRVYVGNKAEARGFIDAVEPRAKALREVNALVRARAAASTEPAFAGNHRTEERTMVKKTNGDADANAEDDTTTTAATVDNAAEAAAEQRRNLEAAEARGRDAERERVRRIREAAVQEQGDLVSQFVAEGTSADVAIEALNKDLRERYAKLRTRPSNTAAVGGGNTAQVVAQPTEAQRIEAMPQGEERWKAEFAADRELHAEFGGDFAGYCAYRRAQVAGAVKAAHRKVAAE